MATPARTTCSSSDGACRIFDFEMSGWGSVVLDAALPAGTVPELLVLCRPSRRGGRPGRRCLPRDSRRRRDRPGHGLGRGRGGRAGRLDRRQRTVDSPGCSMKIAQWGTTTMRPRLLAWLRNFIERAGGDQCPAQAAGYSRRDARPALVALAGGSRAGVPGPGPARLAGGPGARLVAPAPGAEGGSVTGDREERNRVLGFPVERHPNTRPASKPRQPGQAAQPGRAAQPSSRGRQRSRSTGRRTRNRSGSSAFPLTGSTGSPTRCCEYSAASGATGA